MKYFTTITARGVSNTIGSMSMALVLLVGATFAALNTQASITGNTITTTSAELKLWDGADYSSTIPGLSVQDLVPSVGSAEYPLTFKNTGGIPMAIGAHVPTALKFSGFTSTTLATAMKYVKVSIINRSSGDTTDTTLYALTLSTDVPLPGPPLHGGITGNPSDIDSEGNYAIKFDIDPTGIGTVKASIDPFDLVFTGRQVIT